MSAGALCGVAPFFFRKKHSGFENRQRKARGDASAKTSSTPSKGAKGSTIRSGVAGNFVTMTELRNKISTLRDLLDFSPCVGSASVNELLILTMKDLSKRYPKIKLSEIKDVPMHKALKLFCDTLKSLGDVWTDDQEWMFKCKYDSTKKLEHFDLEQIALGLLEDIIKLARERLFDETDDDDEDDDDDDDDDDMSDYNNRPSNAFGKALSESYSDSPMSLSSSPLTPTSVLPKAWKSSSVRERGLSYSPPMFFPLRVQAIEKLNPIDVKRLSFHMYPHAIALAQQENNKDRAEHGQESKRLSQAKPDDVNMVGDIEMKDERAELPVGKMDDIARNWIGIQPQQKCNNNNNNKTVVPDKDVITQTPPPPPLPPPPTIKVLSLSLPPPPPPLPVPATNIVPQFSQPQPSPITAPQPPPPPPPHVMPQNVVATPPLPPPMEMKNDSPMPPPPHVMPQNLVAAPPPPPPIATRNGTPTPPPPPMSMKNSALPPPPPPMGTSTGSPPPPPPGSKGVMPLPPPPLGSNRGGPPPPPGFANLRAKKSATKLKRSSQMANLYRLLKGKVEGSSSDNKLTGGRKGKVGGASASGGKQGMADALAEMTKRSAYFIQIQEDVKNYAGAIKDIKIKISTFETSDMTELLKFHKYVESHLEKLTDETQVLARFEDFPCKKLEAVRMSAALYSKLDSIATTLQKWPIVTPVSQLLDKAESYFNKIKVEMDALERTKDEELKRFKAQKINFDFGVLLRIKESLVDVSSNCMELALKEKREALAKENKDPNKSDGKKNGSVKMLWRAFQFAFRVYTFAGGHDDRADNLTRELASVIETEH